MWDIRLTKKCDNTDGSNRSDNIQEFHIRKIIDSTGTIDSIFLTI